MIKNNLKKISVIIIMLVLLLFAVKTSFATDNDGGIFNQINSLNNSNSGGTIQTGNRNNNTDTNTNNTNNNTNTNTNTNTNNNTNNNTNSPKTTPYTGANNSTTICFIILFAVSSIYAYKKIRDYDA